MSRAAASSAAWLRLTCGPILCLLLNARVLALPADLALSQLHHTQWTVQGGAPSSIFDIVQTRDGYIWMSANGRLFRFDGVAFERIDHIGASPMPSEKIYALWASPSGGLWVGHQYGGATFIHDGTIRSYFTAAGLPHATIMKFAEDSSGGVWAGTTLGLLRLKDERWTAVHSVLQIPQVAIEEMIFDRDGTLWVLGMDALFYLRRGSSRFETGLQLPPGGWSELLVSPEGTAWLARRELGITDLHVPAPGAPLVPRWRTRGFETQEGFHTALIDRDSNLWLSRFGSITRVELSRGEASTETDQTDTKAVESLRLAGKQSGPMLEDREGNLWIASSGGLDKFRASAFVKVPLAQSSYEGNGLAAANDGSVWIGGYDSEMLYRVEGDVTRESVRSPALIHALHRNHAGTLWVGGPDSSIYQHRAGKWIEWHPDDAANSSGIQAIVSEPDGTLWVSIARVGVYRVIDNRWTLWGGLAALPQEPATTLALDFKGRVWLGYVNSRIAVIDRERVTTYGSAHGLSIGAVQATAVRGAHTWVGGEKGLSWFDGQRFHSVLGRESAQPFASVSGIIEKGDGDLWLNTSEGAVSIPIAEVRRFLASSNHQVRYRLFNYLDGMPGAADELRPLPTAVESTDRRIWFSTTDGVATLAPRAPAPNPIVPELYIKSITVDGVRHDIDALEALPLQISSNPHVLQIAYTALSFTIPERVHFKYRLEGSAMGWEEVGMRREAYFTGLPPGRYRFQVIASNDSNVWNETGASLHFVIPPTFLQSREFIVISIAAGCAALWLLFALRMRQVQAQLHSRNEERILERERIARELHDTFLQGVQGLMLRFQSATERIPEGHPARTLMENALDRTDIVLAEGRERVSELRASVSLHLPEALKMLGTELARDSAVSFDAHVEGHRRELNPLVQEEAYRIGAEALTNAFRHACAASVSTIVVFGRRRFEVRVVDDGRGFDESHVKPGRWGLKGIHERAARIRGEIVVSSRPNAGTTVELHIPAKLAYQEAAGSRWSLRRKHKSEEST